MKDVELRGVVLHRFYELRNRPERIMLRDLMSLENDIHRLANICDQLHQCRLIDWKSLKTYTSVGGIGKITARGVDVVEGTAAAPIGLIIEQRNISITGSSNVQIGNANNQFVNAPLKSCDLEKFVAELTSHLDELGLDPRQKTRVNAQLDALKVELSDNDSDPEIVRQALRTVRNVTEGAIASLIATAVQPTVWHWILGFLHSAAG